jgi:hypothetical protein
MMRRSQRRACVNTHAYQRLRELRRSHLAQEPRPRLGETPEDPLLVPIRELSHKLRLKLMKGAAFGGLPEAATPYRFNFSSPTGASELPPFA